MKAIKKSKKIKRMAYASLIILMVIGIFSISPVSRSRGLDPEVQCLSLKNDNSEMPLTPFVRISDPNNLERKFDDKGKKAINIGKSGTYHLHFCIEVPTSHKEQSLFIRMESAYFTRLILKKDNVEIARSGRYQSFEDRPVKSRYPVMRIDQLTAGRHDFTIEATSVNPIHVVLNAYNSSGLVNKTSQESFLYSTIFGAVFFAITISLGAGISLKSPVLLFCAMTSIAATLSELNRFGFVQFLVWDKDLSSFLHDFILVFIAPLWTIMGFTLTITMLKVKLIKWVKWHFFACCVVSLVYSTLYAYGKIDAALALSFLQVLWIIAVELYMLFRFKIRGRYGKEVQRLILTGKIIFSGSIVLFLCALFGIFPDDIAIKFKNVTSIGLLIEMVILLIASLYSIREIFSERDLLSIELTSGEKVANSMLPPMIKDEKIHINHHFVPSLNLGGDMIEHQSQDNQTWTILADVTGHGLPSALVAMQLKGTFRTALRSAVERNLEIKETGSLIVRELYESVKGGSSAATAIIACIDYHDNKIHLFSAAHVPVWMKRGTTVKPFVLGGPHLGTSEDLEPGSTEIAFEPGDIFMFSSDGLWENKTQSGKELKSRAFQKIMLECASGEELINRLAQLFEKPDHMVDKTEEPDDLSIMTVEFPKVG